MGHSTHLNKNGLLKKLDNYYTLYNLNPMFEYLSYFTKKAEEFYLNHKTDHQEILALS